MDTLTLEPRRVGEEAVDEEALFRTLAFEMIDTLDPQMKPPEHTCHFGFTFYCDSDGEGGTCRRGATYYCDGPA